MTSILRHAFISCTALEENWGASISGLNLVDQLVLDDRLEPSLSLHSLLDDETLNATFPAPEKGCLKYSTQVESIEKVYRGGTLPRDSSTPVPTVHWSTVHISLHGIILGENPAVSDGPPVTIEWCPFEEHCVSLGEHEAMRVEAPRRPVTDIILPLHLRHAMIQRSGQSTVNEKMLVIQATRQIRASRALTALCAARKPKRQQAQIN